MNLNELLFAMLTNLDALLISNFKSLSRYPHEALFSSSRLDKLALTSWK